MLFLIILVSHRLYPTHPFNKSLNIHARNYYFKSIPKDDNNNNNNNVLSRRKEKQKIRKKTTHTNRMFNTQREKAIDRDDENSITRLDKPDGR